MEKEVQGGHLPPPPHENHIPPILMKIGIWFNDFSVMIRGRVTNSYGKIPCKISLINKLPE